MQLDYRLVDVFAAEAFRGNPVAVVLGAEGVSTEDMQLITRWFNLSETTFLLEPDDSRADYRARIFTLDRELPFAGHPTLGSTAAWLSAGRDERRGDMIVQECAAGLIEVRTDGHHAAFAAPPVLRYEPADAETVERVASFLRLDKHDIEAVHWIDNGPGWIGVRLASAESVLAVSPDPAHKGRIEVGLVGPCPAGAEYDFEVRALFTDQHGGVMEDPVTGSLNAGLAKWLLDTGVATAPFTAGQGSLLGRRGRIAVSESNGNLWIGGDTHVVVEGRITVPTV